MAGHVCNRGCFPRVCCSWCGVACHTGLVLLQRKPREHARRLAQYQRVVWAHLLTVTPQVVLTSVVHACHTRGSSCSCCCCWCGLTVDTIQPNDMYIPCWLVRWMGLGWRHHACSLRWLWEGLCACPAGGKACCLAQVAAVQPPTAAVSVSSRAHLCAFDCL